MANNNDKPESPENRVKCFLCNNWVKAVVCRKELFYLGEENVCPTCRQKLLDRDRVDADTLKVMERLDAERT
jgi:DNA-directed RNA polymerase subunit RPC12/RpoP